MAIYMDEATSSGDSEKINLDELIAAIVQLYPPEVIINELQQISKLSKRLAAIPEKGLIKRIIQKFRRKKEES